MSSGYDPKPTDAAGVENEAMDIKIVGLPDVGSLHLDTASIPKDELPKSEPNTGPEASIDSEPSVETKDKEPSADAASSEIEPNSDAEVESDSDTEPDSDAVDSDAEGSDVFDEAMLDYNSDRDENMFVAVDTRKGKTIEEIRAPPVIEEHLIVRGTPLYKFLNALLIVDFADLEQKDVGCEVCQDPYVEGDDDVKVRLLCGHVVHRECIASWMGPKEDGGFGQRKCLKCHRKIVVPGE